MAKLSYDEYTKKREKEKNKGWQTSSGKISYDEAQSRVSNYGSLSNYSRQREEEKSKEIDDDTWNSIRTRYLGLVDAASRDGDLLKNAAGGRNRIGRTTPVGIEKGDKWYSLPFIRKESGATRALTSRKNAFDKEASSLMSDLNKYSAALGDTGAEMKARIKGISDMYGGTVAQSQASDQYYGQFKDQKDYWKRTAGVGTGVSGDSIESASKRWEWHLENQKKIRDRKKYTRAEREDFAAEDKQYMDTQGTSDQAVVNTFRNATEKSVYNAEPNDGDYAKYYNESDYIRWLMGRDDPNQKLDDENYKFDRKWSEEVALAENPAAKYEYLTPLEEQTFWAMLHYYEDILSDENKGKYPELTGTPIQYAQEWIDSMAYTLGYREDVEAQKRLEKAPTWAKALTTVAANAPVVSWAGALDAFGDWLGSVMEGKEYNPYGAHSMYMTRSREMQQSTASDLSEMTPQWIKDLTDEDFGALFNNVISAEKFVAGGEMLGPVLYTLEMGMETAPASAAGYRAKGIEKDKANLMAATDAAIEMGTEFVSAELFVKNYLESAPTSATGVLMRKLVQDVVEGSEEVVGTYAGAAMQQVILGSQSDVSKKMRAEMANGKTAGQAFQAAWDEVGEEARHAFVNAVVSSALVSTPGAVIQGASINKAYRNEGSFISQEGADALRNLANDVAGVTGDEIALDKKYAAPVKRAAAKAEKKASDKNVGRLSSIMRESMEKQNAADIETALKDEGMSKAEIKEYSEMFGRLQRDPEYIFSEEEAAKIEEDERLQNALKTLQGPDSAIGKRVTKYNLAREGVNLAEGGEKVSVRKGNELYNRADITDRVSDTGTAVDTITGDAITINSTNPIARVENKDGQRQVYLNTSQGEVLSSEIKYATPEQAVLIEGASDLPVSVANAIIENYQSGNANEYLSGMREGALLYGYSGASLADVPQSSVLKNLSEENQQYAMQIGRLTAQEDKAAVSEATENIKSALNEAKSSGNFVVSKKAGLTQNAISKEMKLSSKTKRGLHALGMSTGAEVKFADEVKDADGNSVNAQYDPNTGTITIAKNTENPLKVAAVHEIVHRVRNVAPEAYASLESFVVNGMKNEKFLGSYYARGKLYGLKDASSITEEVVADAFGELLENEDLMKDYIRQNTKHAQRILNAIRDILDKIKSFITRNNLSKKDYGEFSDLAKRLDTAKILFENAIKQVNEKVTNEAKLAENGIGVDENTNAVYSRGFMPGMNGVASAEELAKMIAETTGRSLEDSRRYVAAESSLAALILEHPEFLDYEPDSRYEAIKNNSDYPQGTVDLSNLCPKREETTVMFDMLQKMMPNELFTADDVAEMRKILEDNGITVACGPCFVEDRRQHVGEAADEFIRSWEAAQENGGPLIKINSKGEKKVLTVSEEVAKRFGLTQGAEFDTSDSYIPNQYDLTTYEGLRSLEKDHPTVAAAFIAYNNSRGQQSARLIEGRAEYKRQILDWNKRKVNNVNKAGGLRIFSFSDFEAVSLLDIVQIVEDCAAKGVKIQGYTKVPVFAKLIRNTGIKINRSLIPLGDTGIKDGKLAYDPKDGIDINDSNFLDERGNPNVGNILIGINPEQIGLAMLDDFVDYIIPFHSNKSKDILHKLGTGKWINYKESQTEKNISDGKTADKQINIYTDVLPKYNPTNKVEFVNAFLEECRNRELVPKYAEFLNKEYTPDGVYTDEGGKFNYTYREGFHKFLVDFKMFDQNGNIRPQEQVVPDMDPELLTDILKKEVDRKANYKFPQEVFDKVKERFGAEEGKKYSRTVSAEENARYLELAKDPVKNEAELQRMVEEAATKAGYDSPKLYHGTTTFGWTKPELQKGEHTRGGELGVWTATDVESVRYYAGEARDVRRIERGNTEEEIEETKWWNETFPNRDQNRMIADGIYQFYGNTDGFLEVVPEQLPHHFDNIWYNGKKYNTVSLAQYAKDNGYKGLHIDSILDGNVDSNEYIFFDPQSQLKSADPVTYDDNGNAIPLSERFNPESNDIRESRGSREDIAKLVEEYGKMPAGERPFRDIEVPQRTSRSKKVSQSARNILEAQATPETLVPKIQELIEEGVLSHEVYTDDQAMEDAQSIIKRKGYATALADWLNSVRKGTVSKANTTMGWELYRNAAQSGDTESALTVLRAMVGHQRNAAQALQASRILKKMSPEAQLYNAQKMLEQIIDDYKKRTKKDLDIKIDSDLAGLFLEARDQETRDDILGKIFQQIGRQIPATLRDKFQAWRYMAMLTNPTTHIRNLAGNLGFAPVVAVKDLTATGIESAIRFVSGGKFEGTKGNILGKGGAELFKAAWNDYANVMDEALGEGKYTEESYANKNVQKGHRVFKFVPLEIVRRGNTWLLDKEDVLFNKPHYVLAMAQYCKARGITAEQIRKGEGLEGARAYAIKEAQKATYRDTNVFSQAVSKLGRYRGDSKLLKAGSMAVEGILPFRKTPANILVRGLEYSPLGLLKSITHDAAGVLLNAKMQEAQANGKDITPAMRRMQNLVTPMTAAEMIDHLSAGLTGTGLAALGVLLASMGLVRGHGDDDDKKSAFDKLLGHQHYALEIGGTSITLDWLAPEALPFFVGVNLAEEAKKSKDGLKMEDLLNAVSNISEPLLEMSCLQGVNSLLENWQSTKSDGMNPLMGALTSAVTSYVTQYVPTVFGKAERLFEDKRYRTYRDSNSFLTGGMQYTLGQISAKIPGWDYHQVPYIDAWGREEATSNFGVRVFNNFVNPAFVKTVKEEDMETELLRLYDLFKDDKVTLFPSAAKRSVSSNGESKDLTMNEYVTYAKAQGGTAYAVIGHMVDTAAYKELPDALKAEAVDDAYTYAHQTALTTVGLEVGEKENWVNKAMDAKKQGISPDQYIIAKVVAGECKSITDKDGKAIDNSSGLLKMQAIYKIPGLSDTQRKYLFGCVGVGSKVIGYSRQQVNDALAEMKKK